MVRLNPENPIPFNPDISTKSIRDTSKNESKEALPKENGPVRELLEGSITVKEFLSAPPSKKLSSKIHSWTFLNNLKNKLPSKIRNFIFKEKDSQKKLSDFKITLSVNSQVRFPKSSSKKAELASAPEIKEAESNIEAARKDIPEDTFVEESRQGAEDKLNSYMPGAFIIRYSANVNGLVLTRKLSDNKFAHIELNINKRKKSELTERDWAKIEQNLVLRNLDQSIKSKPAGTFLIYKDERNHPFKQEDEGSFYLTINIGLGKTQTHPLGINHISEFTLDEWKAIERVFRNYETNPIFFSK